MTHQTLPTGSVSPEQAAREQSLVDEVVASFAGAESPRLRELMGAPSRGGCWSAWWPPDPSTAS